MFGEGIFGTADMDFSLDDPDVQEHQPPSEVMIKPVYRGPAVSAPAKTKADLIPPSMMPAPAMPPAAPAAPVANGGGIDRRYIYAGGALAAVLVGWGLWKYSQRSDAS